jgi:hypothetical protein
MELDDANYTEAMIMEFSEETGVDNCQDQWYKFGTMTFIKDI